MSYIVPRKKPKRCSECQFMLKGTFDCRMNKESYKYISIDKQYANCPLIELPPHERMIDADALMTEFMDSDLDHLQRDDWREVIQIVADAPTIIEAEGNVE